MGQSPSKMPFGYDEPCEICTSYKKAVCEKIEDLIGKGFVHFLSGGAQGFDTFAAEAVLDLQKQYPWIILEMVSPFDAQADKWDRDYRLRHNKLFKAANIVTNIDHAYTKDCMFKRNRYLVDHADLLLAAFDGQPGGTAMTCAYARRAGVPIQTIMPNTSC